MMSEEEHGFNFDHWLSRSFWFILDEHGEPKRAKTMEEWMLGHSNWEKHRVAFDKVGEAEISTVFRHVSCNNPPDLWETMVFGGPFDHLTERCAGSREQAEAMHARVLEKVKGGK